MMRFGDDHGQVFTMEGIVAGLIIVFAIIFITNSISLVSPQTENAAAAKLSIKAQDTLAVLDSIDQPSNFSSVLHRDITAWTGYEGNIGAEIDPREPSIQDLDQQIHSSLYATAPNVLYNLQVMYVDDTNTLVTKTLIYHGDSQNLTLSAVSAYKKIVLNEEDLNGLPDSYWKTMQKPQSLEVVLIMWSV